MMEFTSVNFIIPIYSQSVTICSFVEPFLTTYSNESAKFGNYEIHSIRIANFPNFKNVIARIVHLL